LHFQPTSTAEDQPATFAVKSEATVEALEPVAVGGKSAKNATQELALGSDPFISEAAPDPDLTRWADKLKQHMETERPYLAPELTLSELASQLRTNTSLLSRVINTCFGQNFNDFINGYRIAEAERKLQDPRFQHYTLLAVALESGFNSKSTFNRVFKKLKSATPSEVAARLNT
jgi:AraC-like DNA-binding protein